MKGEKFLSLFSREGKESGPDKKESSSEPEGVLDLEASRVQERLIKVNRLAEAMANEEPGTNPNNVEVEGDRVRKKIEPGFPEEAQGLFSTVLDNLKDKECEFDSERRIQTPRPLDFFLVSDLNGENVSYECDMAVYLSRKTKPHKQVAEYKLKLVISVNEAGESEVERIETGEIEEYPSGKDPLQLKS